MTEKTKKIKVKFFISTGFIGSDVEETLNIEIPESYTEQERNKYINECFEDWKTTFVDESWAIIEDEND